MIENIERYFRSFDTMNNPYFHIIKIDSKLLKVIGLLKEISNV